MSALVEKRLNDDDMPACLNQFFAEIHARWQQALTDANASTPHRFVPGTMRCNCREGEQHE